MERSSKLLVRVSGGMWEMQKGQKTSFTQSEAAGVITPPTFMTNFSESQHNTILGSERKKERESRRS